MPCKANNNNSHKLIVAKKVNQPSNQLGKFTNCLSVSGEKHEKYIRTVMGTKNIIKTINVELLNKNKHNIPQLLLSAEKTSG